jgi:ATP-dependent Clp protease ATP-binding subunit ClpB
MDALRQQFRPEFLNRVDEVILFHALGREDLAQIVDIQIKRLAATLATRQIGLQISAEARAALANEGYDPVYGARPLKRTIQRRIQDPLALHILRGEFHEGDTVLVDHVNEEYTFSLAEKAHEAAR